MLGDGNVADIDDDTYDVVTLSGGFVPGHVPLAAIHDLIRMCKPGASLPFVCPSVPTLSNL